MRQPGHDAAPGYADRVAFPSAIIDAVESWLAGQSFWIQVPIVLAVLVPLCWLVAGGVDKLVELALRRHSARDAATDAALVAAARNPGVRPQVPR